MTPVVERWTVKWDETEVPDGEYVRAEDYDAAINMLRAIEISNDYWRRRRDAFIEDTQ